MSALQNLDLILGALFILILGGYGYTTLIGKWLLNELGILKNNHIAHLEEDVKELRRKLDGQSTKP